MSGLENMKRQILDEANHSAEEQISKARTKAEEILREAREQMEEQSAVMAKKSEDETKDYAQRIASSSEMQRKQALLQAKQEVIQEVLNKAYQQVLHLEPESYFEMLQKLLETYALPQEGTIYFSAADLARMPQDMAMEQRILVISSPSISTIGVVILIFSMFRILLNFFVSLFFQILHHMQDVFVCKLLCQICIVVSNRTKDLLVLSDRLSGSLL